MKVPNTSNVFGRAPVIATSGYQVTEELKSTQ